MAYPTMIFNGASFVMLLKCLLNVVEIFVESQYFGSTNVLPSNLFLLTREILPI